MPSGLRDDDEHRIPYLEPSRDRIELEQSSETFDRVAFALEAMDRLPPRLRTVVVHETGAGRGVRIDESRSWAILSVDRTASRRAIAHAVASIAKQPIAAWSFDVLDRIAFDQ
ncbi:MAG TPA: hypothetical protein VF407_07745 [Polyangiaceae bacterium]